MTPWCEVRRATCEVRGATCEVRRVRRRVGVCGLVVLWASAAAAQTSPISLATLEARALERHPAIAKAAAEVEVARGRVTQAGAWVNPAIGAGVSEWRPRETPSGSVGGFVEQTFSLGGKRSAARDTASAELMVREAALARARQDVRAGVRVAYYEFASATERRGVAGRLASVADDMVSITRQLMNVGLADRPDLLVAEAEAARFRVMADNARVHEAAAWRRLGIAAADPAMAAQPVRALADAEMPALDRQTMLERILQSHPELQEAQAAAARERSVVDVERTRMFPDLSLRGEVAWNREHLASRGQAKGWEFGVQSGIRLPLFNTNRGGLMAARAGVTAAEANVALRRLEVESRVADAFEAYERARALAEAYATDVLPRLEEAMSLHQSRYSEMGTPYPQVLASRQQYLEALAEYHEQLGEAWRAAARLESLLLEVS